MKYSILLAVFLNGYALSQDGNVDSAKVYPLPEVVITATRTGKYSFDVGKGISLIPGEELKESYFNDLSGLISSKEGIYVVGDRQNFGTNQSIFMRGANSNQTAIMIDDIRITDPSSVNNTPDVSEFSLANIEKIEIVRGMNSALYGSSAIGGVINMFSRKNQNVGFNAEINLNGGTFGRATSLFAQDLFLNYTSPAGLYMNSQIVNLNVHGIDATVDTVTTAGVFKNRDRDGFRHRDLCGKLGYAGEVLDLYLSYKRTDQKKDLDRQAYVDDDNYTLGFRRNLYTYGISFYFTKGLNLKFIGGYSDMERKAIDDSSKIDWYGNYDHTYRSDRYAGTTSTNELQFIMKFPEVDILLGGCTNTETMSSRLYYYSRSNWGVYESTTDLDKLGLHASTNSAYFHSDLNGKLITDDLNNVSLALSGRILKHSSFGSEIIYEINPSVKINSSALLYASYANGFNAPSLYQLYSPDKDYTSGITRGNKHLKPEYSSSFEIGLKQTIAKSFEIGMSYFTTRTKDLIEYVYLWDKNIGLDTLGNNFLRNDYRGDTYLNIGDQTMHGIEFNFQSRIDKALMVSGNISLADGKINYHPSGVDTSVTHGNHAQILSNGAFLNRESEYIGLVRRPNSANIALQYSPKDWLSLRLDVKYVGRRGDVYYDSELGPYGALGTTPVAEYTLVDLASKFSLTDRMAIGTRLENVFNARYIEIKGFSTRGRGLFINLRYIH